jgi:hypothetical protein
MGRGFGGFLATATIVVVLVSSVSDGSINLGGVADNVISYGLALVEASMDAMRASGDLRHAKRHA